MHAKHVWSALSLATLFALSACGGGGGGSGAGASASSGTTPAPAVPAAPSPVPVSPAVPPAAPALIPEAGPVGATLYESALVLRVLRPDAVWTYRGTEGNPSVGMVPLVYTNIVTQAGSGAVVSQTASNAFNGGTGAARALRYDSGTYKFATPAAFIQGNVTLAADIVELRSPVKLNDQYTSLDQKGVNLGIDLDGDKVNDTADFAVYARVIGKEFVDLPNRLGVDTVRVDTTMRSRSTLSAKGTLTPVNEVVYSHWYAPGVGVVKSRLSKADVVGGTLPGATMTEVLQNWDGLTEGLGQTARVKATAPASSLLAGSELQYPFDAVGFGTHAVVGAFLPNKPPSAGVVLAQLDPGGKVLSARNYGIAELFPGAEYLTDLRLLRYGDELRMLAKVGPGDIGMVAFDASGQRIVRASVRLLSEPMMASNLQEPSFRAAIDDTGVWVGWRHFVNQGTGLYRYAMSLRQFTLDGQAVGSARTFLSPADTTNILDSSLAIDGTRLALSWRSVDALDTRRMILIDTTSGALLAERPVDVSSEQCFHIRMVALRPGLAAVCSNGSSRTVGAARLGTNGEFLLSSGPTLPGEKLSAPWYSGFWGGEYTGSKGELMVAGLENGRYWPEEDSSFFTVVFRTRSAGGPLSAGQPELLARIKNGDIALSKIVLLDKRSLIIERDQQGYLHSTSVWLPN